jgi:hypothetical protein
MTIIVIQSLDQLFERHKYYSKGNNVAAKAEKANIESVKRTLLNLTTPDGKKRLYNYNIFILFNSNTLSSFCRELNDFIAEIEQQVFIVMSKLSMFQIESFDMVLFLYFSML